METAYFDRTIHNGLSFQEANDTEILQLLGMIDDNGSIPSKTDHQKNAAQALTAEEKSKRHQIYRDTGILTISIGMAELAFEGLKKSGKIPVDLETSGITVSDAIHNIILDPLFYLGTAAKYRPGGSKDHIHAHNSSKLERFFTAAKNKALKWTPSAAIVSGSGYSLYHVYERGIKSFEINHFNPTTIAAFGFIALGNTLTTESLKYRLKKLQPIHEDIHNIEHANIDRNVGIVKGLTSLLPAIGPYVQSLLEVRYAVKDTVLAHKLVKHGADVAHDHGSTEVDATSNDPLRGDVTHRKRGRFKRAGDTLKKADNFFEERVMNGVIDGMISPITKYISRRSELPEIPNTKNSKIGGRPKTIVGSILSIAALYSLQRYGLDFDPNTSVLNNNLVDALSQSPPVTSALEATQNVISPSSETTLDGMYSAYGFMQSSADVVESVKEVMQTTLEPYNSLTHDGTYWNIAADMLKEHGYDTPNNAQIDAIKDRLLELNGETEHSVLSLVAGTDVKLVSEAELRDLALQYA